MVRGWGFDLLIDPFFFGDRFVVTFLGRWRRFALYRRFGFFLRALPLLFFILLAALFFLLLDTVHVHINKHLL